MHRGFAKLYRKFLEWEWYDDIPCKVLYVHCILKANHKDKNYRGTPVARGTFLTSFSDLAAETGLTVKQVRIAQKKLEPQYLASKRTNKGQTISVVDFDTYNSYTDEEGKQDGTQGASMGHTEGTQGATTKNVKNGENVNNTPKPPKGATLATAKRYLERNGIDWIPSEIWFEWCEYKKQKKCSLTDRSMGMNVSEIEKIDKSKAEYLLTTAMSRGWKAVYNPDKNNLQEPTRQPLPKPKNNLKMIWED